MKQPENQSKKYSALFNDIDEGRVKIPQFQRDFVWTKAQTAALIDSILKGFPIGTFILWKTNERLRHMRNIGNIELKEPRPGDPIQYVLDGQQRITSLYAVRKGVIITREGEEIDYKDIAIDLTIDLNDDEEEVVFEQAIDGHQCISVSRLLNDNASALWRAHGEQFLDRISEYKSRLEGYDFSTVVIDEYPIDVACEVFTRINTGGKELTLFEIMVAKTFDQGRDFDLAERYRELISTDGDDKDLRLAGYDELPAETILHCVAANASGSIKRKDVLRITRKRFIDSWETTIEGMFAAIDYLRANLGADRSRILPYNALLIPFSWFFVRQGDRDISEDQHALLRQYFYWASLSHRFQSAADTKIAEDLRKMKRILARKQPRYDRQELKIESDDLEWQPFSVGNAFCKAVICLLAEKGPLSLTTNGKVILDNSWLKSSSSKNYHHFFPHSFLQKCGYGVWESNSLMNIVLVDEYLNKRVIRARAPSEYVAEFKKRNRNLRNALATHYIRSPREMGIWSDNYETFVKRRAEDISAALTRALNPELE